MVQASWEEIPLPWEGYDLVVAHNPHANPIIMKSLAGWAGSGKPILVDMDTDFRSIHTGSPERRINDQDALADINAVSLPPCSWPTSSHSRPPDWQLQFANEGYQAYNHT